MKLKRSLVLAAVIAGMTIGFPSAQAQVIRSTSNKPVKIKDKSKPVRAALEAQYAKIANSYREGTPEVILDLRMPNFSVHMPDGSTWSAATSAQYIRMSFARLKSNELPSFTIGNIDVHGDTAAAMIYQQWSRTQMTAGQVRKVETSACQRETWIRTHEGWRMILIDSVRPMIWKVDGKRVDPASPNLAGPVFVPPPGHDKPCDGLS
jgi:hypothetical protein